MNFTVGHKSVCFKYILKEIQAVIMCYKFKQFHNWMIMFVVLMQLLWN